MKTSRIYSGALAVLCAAALVIGSAGAVAIMQKGTVKDPVSGQVPGEKIVGMLDNLTAQGYDVSAIRTAVESGNYTTAMTLIREFRTANPDAFPARAHANGRGRVSGQVPGEKMVGMLDNLTAQGYDVSAIRTAVESGNCTTGMAQLREFRTANPDAFPARANGTGNGHRAGRGGPGTTNSRIGF